MDASVAPRRKRKEEGKLLKRKRIEESGGVRPRKAPSPDKPPLARSHAGGSKHLDRERVQTKNRGPPNGRKPHRFGRVMETVPCPQQPRFSTVSIAVPGSIVANCQTRELKTQLTGQIARAATIYHVDEIVIYDDQLARNPSRNNYHRNYHRKDEGTETQKEVGDLGQRDNTEQRARFSEPHAFLARLLQYCECPQYLRRHFFPMHPDLQFAGLLHPIDAPHHVRAEDRSTFREGVVLEKRPPRGSGSLVNCGIRSRPVLIDQRLQPGIRCTIQLNVAEYGRPGQMHGTVVSPRTPTHTDGTYWGYSVRMADSIKAVMDECPYGSYDLTIGTSERGRDSVDDSNFSVLKKGTSSYQHALIVFGGVAGIEECVDADESLKLSGSNSQALFDKWVNICPFQASRTIRSEEAVLITLAKLSPKLTASARNHAESSDEEEEEERDEVIPMKFSDNELSDESSDNDDKDDTSSDDSQ